MEFTVEIINYANGNVSNASSVRLGLNTELFSQVIFFFGYQIYVQSFGCLIFANFSFKMSFESYA